MASLYVGVYRAIYDYEARADEELTIHADDLLYLLEKSDVDEWWKVKKRVLPVGDEEVEEPVGLIPSNYIEEVCSKEAIFAIFLDICSRSVTNSRHL